MDHVDSDTVERQEDCSRQIATCLSSGYDMRAPSSLISEAGGTKVLHVCQQLSPFRPRAGAHGNGIQSHSIFRLPFRRANVRVVYLRARQYSSSTPSHGNAKTYLGGKPQTRQRLP